MKKQGYNSATDEELAEAYKNMMDFTGRISPDMQAAIDGRGGFAIFQQNIDFRKQNRAEFDRIRMEVAKLFSPEMDLVFLKTLITSEKVSATLLEREIELEFARLTARQHDESVTSRTIFGSLAGILLGFIAGTAVILGSVWLFERLFYQIVIPVFLINYLIIKGITRQSRNNLLVFIACVFATVAAWITVLWMLRQ